MDRAGVGSGVRRGDRGPGAGGGGAADPGPGRRRPRAMAAPGATHQGDARDFRPRGRGHDLPRRPPRGRHSEEPAHTLQRKPHIRESLRI